MGGVCLDYVIISAIGGVLLFVFFYFVPINLKPLYKLVYVLISLLFANLFLTMYPHLGILQTALIVFLFLFLVTYFLAKQSFFQHFMISNLENEYEEYQISLDENENTSNSEGAQINQVFSERENIVSNFAAKESSFLENTQAAGLLVVEDVMEDLPSEQVQKEPTNELNNDESITTVDSISALVPTESPLSEIDMLEEIPLTETTAAHLDEVTKLSQPETNDDEEIFLNRQFVTTEDQTDHLIDEETIVSDSFASRENLFDQLEAIDELEIDEHQKVEAFITESDYSTISEVDLINIAENSSLVEPELTEVNLAEIDELDKQNTTNETLVEINPESQPILEEINAIQVNELLEEVDDASQVYELLEENANASQETELLEENANATHETEILEENDKASQENELCEENDDADQVNEILEEIDNASQETEIHEKIDNASEAIELLEEVDDASQEIEILEENDDADQVNEIHEEIDKVSQTNELHKEIDIANHIITLNEVLEKHGSAFEESQLFEMEALNIIPNDIEAKQETVALLTATKPRLNRQIRNIFIEQLQVIKRFESSETYETNLLAYVNEDLDDQDYYIFASLLRDHYIETGQFSKLKDLITTLKFRFSKQAIIMEEISFFEKNFF